MCFHKSFVAKYNHLLDHYSASFDSVTEELELIRERFSVLMARDQKQEPYNKDEIKELKDLQKVLSCYGETEYRMYHENGFDFLPSPIITAGAPEEFKLFRWGLVPFFMPDREKAFGLRVSTLNCISEEMYEKRSFQDAAKNGQRCLIPVTGFYEWRWMDEKGKVKIPYYVSFKEQPIMSLAGLYSRWKDRTTNQYYYSYTVLTTPANALMEYVHNNKRRMPVIIPREYERDWLDKDLSRDDVLALCRPFRREAMKANTISKLITTRDADTNTDEVLKLHTYEKTGTEEIITEL